MNAKSIIDNARIERIILAEREAVCEALSFDGGVEARDCLAALKMSAYRRDPLEAAFRVTEDFQARKDRADRRATRLAKIVDRLFVRATPIGLPCDAAPAP